MIFHILCKATWINIIIINTKFLNNPEPNPVCYKSVRYVILINNEIGRDNFFPTSKNFLFELVDEQTREFTRSKLLYDALSKQCVSNTCFISSFSIAFDNNKTKRTFPDTVGADIRYTCLRCAHIANELFLLFFLKVISMPFRKENSVVVASTGTKIHPKPFHSPFQDIDRTSRGLGHSS